MKQIKEIMCVLSPCNTPAPSHDLSIYFTTVLKVSGVDGNSLLMTVMDKILSTTPLLELFVRPRSLSGHAIWPCSPAKE